MPLDLQNVNKRSAAVGATIASEPIVKQALRRMRSGQLSAADFSRLYGPNVRAAKQVADSRHAPSWGFGSKTHENYLKTLAER